MARFAKSMPNVKKVAFIRHTDDWADAHVKGIQDELKQSNLQVVGDFAFERNATDATAQVLKAKEVNPDVIFLVTYPNESATFLRDAKKYDLKGPFIAASSNMDLAAVAERAGGMDAVANVYTSSYLTGPIGSSEMKEPTDLYKKYFPNDKIQTLSFYGMSGAYAVVDAIKRAGPDLTREKFLAALEATKDAYAGPAYCKITFSAQDHQGCSNGTVWGVRNGQIVTIGPSWKP
jgi:branched-chain amino acid transport system substrate-binding protein